MIKALLFRGQRAGGHELRRLRLVHLLRGGKAFRQERLEAMERVVGLFELGSGAIHRRLGGLDGKLQLGILGVGDFDLSIEGRQGRLCLFQGERVVFGVDFEEEIARVDRLVILNM